MGGLMSFRSSHTAASAALKTMNSGREVDEVPTGAPRGFLGQLGDQAVRHLSLKRGDVHLRWALGATAALLPISILLICASRSRFQIFLLR